MIWIFFIQPAALIAGKIILQVTPRGSSSYGIN